MAIKINPLILNEFSTKEKIIGTWIDGNPIYRKVCMVTNLVNGNNDISFDGSEINELINVYGNLLFDGSGSGWQPIPRVTSSLDYVTSIGNIRSTSFRIIIGPSYENCIKGYIVFEYTKTM